MRTIGTRELKSIIDDERELLFLNVLSEEDFARAHIPGSRNLPISREDFVERIADMAGGKDARIVVYCSSFDCEASTKAAKLLDKAGFKEVLDYEGGMKQWLEDGNEIERSSMASAH